MNDRSMRGKMWTTSTSGRARLEISIKSMYEQPLILVHCSTHDEHKEKLKTWRGSNEDIPVGIEVQLLGENPGK